MTSIGWMYRPAAVRVRSWAKASARPTYTSPKAFLFASGNCYAIDVMSTYGIVRLTSMLFLGAAISTFGVQWIGVVEEINGQWDLVEKGKSVSKAVSRGMAVPQGAGFRIRAPRGKASGYLRIGMSDGKKEEFCCAGTRCKLRTDCGELMTIPVPAPRGAMERLLQEVGQLLFSAPAKYQRPAIGGRGADEISAKDGVAALPVAGVLELNDLLERTGSGTGGGQFGLDIDPVKAPCTSGAARIMWRLGRLGAVNVKDLAAGVHRLHVCETGATKVADLWVLLVAQKELGSYRDRFLSATSEMKRAEIAPDAAAAIGRAYLEKLGQDMGLQK